MKKKTKQQEKADLIEYVAFLKKRIESKNFKSNVSTEEFEKTKKKYDNAKFRLKILT